MAHTDDVQEYGTKYENQLDKLRDADIAVDDYAEIQAFIDYEDGNRNVNTGTLVSHLNRLRLSAERSDVPLVEMEKRDVDRLLADLKRGHGLSEGTVRNYRKALRVFYKWRGESWAEDIKIGASPERKVDPDTLLTDSDIDALLDTAPNLRDKAAIALLADAGFRIGAVASLRVRDVDLSGRLGMVSVNENGNNKDATGAVPITWSRGYVAKWLSEHPRSDNPDAALIHKLRQSDGGDGAEVGDDGAMTYQYLSRRVRWIGNRAGVEPEKLRTHNFRKTAISRWIREEVPEQQIKHRAFWAKDSSQFDVYSGVTSEEMNQDIGAFYGIVDEDDDRQGGMTECPQCNAHLRGSESFCGQCGPPLTDDAAATVADAEDRAVEHAAETGGESAQSALRLRELVQANPEMVVEALEEASE
jgi:integrase